MHWVFFSHLRIDAILFNGLENLRMLCKCTCKKKEVKEKRREKESGKMEKRERQKEKNRQMHLKDVISNFDEN